MCTRVFCVSGVQCWPTCTCLPAQRGSCSLTSRAATSLMLARREHMHDECAQAYLYHDSRASQRMVWNHAGLLVRSEVLVKAPWLLLHEHERYFYKDQVMMAPGCRVRLWATHHVDREPLVHHFSRVRLQEALPTPHPPPHPFPSQAHAHALRGAAVGVGAHPGCPLRAPLCACGRSDRRPRPCGVSSSRAATPTTRS